MELVQLPVRDPETPSVDQTLIDVLENLLVRVKAGEELQALLVVAVENRYEFTVPNNHGIALLMMEQTRCAIMKQEGW